MTLSDIKFRQTSTSSLSVGSTFSKQDLYFYTDGSSSLNFPFGKLKEDFVKFSVYDTSNNFITSSGIYADGTYTQITQSYYDVYNKTVVYSYETFTSDWPVIGSPTQSLFFDVSKQMNSLGLNDGNYLVTIELMRDMVGAETASNDKLIINTISSNRDEIALVPKYLAGTTSAPMDSFMNFATGKFKIKEVAHDLLNLMAAPEMYTIYYKASAQNPTGSNSLKFNYGFTSRLEQQLSGSLNFNARGVERNADIDVVAFLTDMYYGVRKGNIRANGQYAINDIVGIYDQFRNWMYLNYESATTFEEIKTYFYSLFRFIADLELNHITNRKPEDYDEIISFLQTIYYELIFSPSEAKIESAYVANVSGYFKNMLNVNGYSVSILNKKYVEPTDENFNGQLVLKLENPLPVEFDLGTEAWITNNFGFQPIVQNLYFFTKPVFNTIKLRGPNFLIRTESEGNSTEALSMEELIEETGSLYDEMISKIGARTSGTIDNTDYRYFKEFVNFSSAVLRMSAFDWKVSQLEQLRSNVADLSIKLASNPDDQFYLAEYNSANNEIDQIEASMDGYESFLYNNDQWYDIHAESASLYDTENGNSLINNLPKFIVEDSENNADYITFVGMVGHFFDNMSVAIKQITEKNNYSSSPNYGVSLEIVGDMLRSLGWDAEISKENLPILLASFSKKDFDVGTEYYNKARSFSEEERNQVIWKRILNTLPYLYKTKGTEAGLDALITCFGIPKNIVKIREFGGIHNTADLQDTTLCVVDEVKYEPYFSGSGEYFKIDWTGSAQTLEFNFAFDPSKTSEEGKVFRLITCDTSWALGAYRERGEDWGRLFFSLDDGSGSAQTIMTNKAPIFDGRTYHAMLRRTEPVDPLVLMSASAEVVDVFPSKYDLYVQVANDARIAFTASSSFYFSGSYNTSFRSGSNLYIGNYQQNTSSIVNDPEAFYGNIDEIKIWEGVVSNERFENHTLHQNSYDLDSPKQMVSENLFRISFERPVDLYDSGSSSVLLNNLSFRDDFPTFEAINFPESSGPVPITSECDTGYGPVFPYQFSRKDVRQTVKLPDYGSNKFRSNKINYVRQELVSNLSPAQRSSMQSSQLVSVDANKLGVFFSPSETQNMEIIKFFGDYPLMDLIGDPSSVYESSYKKFNKFKQVFYDQGFGAIDYQFFMNIVRFYFDKAMLKYIRSMVPARAKLIDGILIEPSILERPKLEIKPMQQQVVEQRVGVVDGKQTPIASGFPRLTASLDFRDHGTSILRDVNQSVFPIDSDPYGFGVYSDDFGITFYNGDYYRTDTIRYRKQYQAYNKYNLPTSNLSDYEKNINLNGTVQTLGADYYKLNLARLPIVRSYPMTMSFLNSATSFYLSGSIGFGPVAIQGSGQTYTSSISHTISGFITGSILGSDPRRVGQAITSSATILPSGLRVSGSAINLGPTGSAFVYVGRFSLVSGSQLFEGSVSYTPSFAGITSSMDLSRYNVSFIPTDFTSSIFDQFKTNTNAQNNLFLPIASGLAYRKEISMLNYPSNAKLLVGYSQEHYKYTREQFSHKIINSYDQSNSPVKWKKGSQNKKTTVDPTSGLLDNTEPIETKTV